MRLKFIRSGIPGMVALLQVGTERSKAQRGLRLSLAINSNCLASPGQVRDQPNLQCEDTRLSCAILNRA
jgi:hypothetical protein